MRVQCCITTLPYLGKNLAFFSSWKEKQWLEYGVCPSHKDNLDVMQVFVELEELRQDPSNDQEWEETARWIKFEEDVEEGSGRWGRPHVSALAFHSLVDLRKGLEKGEKEWRERERVCSLFCIKLFCWLL